MGGKLHTQMTLDEWSTLHPELICLFVEKGLNCGGNCSLDEACRKKGMDPNRFLESAEELLRAHTTGPVSFCPDSHLPQLIEYILKRFHKDHRRDFEKLESLFAEILSVGGEQHEDLSRLVALCQELMGDMEPHMAKEERVLFPLLLNLARENVAQLPPCVGDPAGPIGVMRRDHERVGTLLDRLDELTDHFTPKEGWCDSYKGAYILLSKINQEIRLHVHLEDNVLFPMAQKLTNRIP